MIGVQSGPPGLRVHTASMQRMVMQQVQMMQLMEKRPVMLVSPYTITIK